MRSIRYSAGEVIFREGEVQTTMFEIRQGRVGVYLDYGSEREKLLTELGEQRFLGEMGLIEACPRSATAVALENGTELEEISEEEFETFLRSRPELLLKVLRQMSARIRENTEKYEAACRALFEYAEAEKSGAEDREALDRQMEDIGREAPKKRPIQTGLRSAFFAYVQEDLAAYEGKREVVKAGLVERLVVRRISVDDMHVNPDDEFCDPNVGPSDRIINEYVHEIPRLWNCQEPIFPSPVVVYKIKPEGYMILNGHHRWAAAVKSGLGKIRAAIINPKS